jgi:hypothetical protein
MLFLFGSRTQDPFKRLSRAGSSGAACLERQLLHRLKGAVFFTETKILLVAAKNRDPMSYSAYQLGAGV